MHPRLVVPSNSKFNAAWSYEGVGKAPLLCEQLYDLEDTRPYQGLRVLHCVPLTPAAVCKIHILVSAGACVDVCRHPLYKPKSESLAVEILHGAGVRVLETTQVQGKYDIHLDCVASLLALHPPTIGAAEMTQAGDLAYKQAALSIPVISVNDSFVKDLETLLGTSESFLRALPVVSDLPIGQQRILVFGFGRVGKGIVFRLMREGVPVSVVTKTAVSAQRAKEFGLTACEISDSASLAELLGWCTTVVTATGQPNMMSCYVSLSALEGKILTNMGSLDEYGPKFRGIRILAHLNFAVEPPTLVKYLECTFYAHNRVIQHLIDNVWSPGYHPYPQEDARAIIHRWTDLHGGDEGFWSAISKN